MSIKLTPQSVERQRHDEESDASPNHQLTTGCPSRRRPLGLEDLTDAAGADGLPLNAAPSAPLDRGLANFSAGNGKPLGQYERERQA